jgi:class 3 adenylate cyclase
MAKKDDDLQEPAATAVPRRIRLREFDLPLPTSFSSSSALSPSFRRLRLFLDEEALEKQKTLDAEIIALRDTLEEQIKSLSEEKKTAQEKEQRISALEGTLEEYQAKQRLGVLLYNVRPEAGKRLLESDEFQRQFFETSDCHAFVMSVDIRRSTELMLKARSPDDFSKFILTLCTDLHQIILDSCGVFDKFTGDGVLCFFPDFYSGNDAAYRTLSAADRCHDAFRRHYHAFRKSFSSVLTDVGLGIGIDFGTVRLVKMAGGLTVVGVPVVYACRLSGAAPGQTLLNQPAYEQIAEKIGSLCFTAETTLDIKYEGRLLAYEARLNGRPYTPIDPDWLTTGQAQ